MKFLNLIIITIGLSSCFILNNDHRQTEIINKKLSKLDTTQLEQDSSVLGIILPYRKKIDSIMSIQIGIADVELLNERPQGNLGNAMADMFIKYHFIHHDNFPIVCLFNTGSFRAPISKGPIFLSKAFEVLPFENQVAAIRVSKFEFNEICKIIIQKRGESISGFNLEYFKNKDSISHNIKTDSIWIITSDYMSNGGDNYQIFKQISSKIIFPITVRDYFIQELKKMYLRNEYFTGKKDNRIIINE